MKTQKRHVMVFLGTLLVAAVLSGVAAAGNPHGTPPGQAKKQSSTPTSSTSTSSTPSSTPSSSNSTGVKPSSTTQHNTHAAAGSNATKSYGNGKTAGQVAMQNGASPSTDLYGPGNSQPHKVAVCSKNGKTHMVDVHALKAHQAGACTSSSTASTTGAVSPESVAGTTVEAGTTAGARIHLKGAGAFTPPRSSQHGGVLGAQHAVIAQAKPAHAVVGSANFTG